MVVSMIPTRFLRLSCVLATTVLMGCTAASTGDEPVGPEGGNTGEGGKTGVGNPASAAPGSASAGSRGTTMNSGGTPGSLAQPANGDVAPGSSHLDGGPAADARAVVDASQVCGPTGGGPYWVEEGATVTAMIKCATGRIATGDSFTLGTLPKGATYDAATATVTWKTGLDQGGVYLIPITGKAGNETGQLKIGVADKFDDPTNVPIKDASIYTEEFGLPVFHLKQGPEFGTNLKIMQTQQLALWADSCKIQCGPSMFTPVTVVYRGKTYMAEGHYRGASTLWSPKHNYTIRFAKDDKFSEPFMGGGKMVKRRRIALIQNLDDNSHLRNRMAFELWNRLDPKMIHIEHYSAVVYVNGKYVGLYAVSDKIDDDMMQRAGLAEDGNIYMGMGHEANFDKLVREENAPNVGMLRPRHCPFEGFTKKDGLPEECDGLKPVPAAYNDLAAFIDFVANSDDAKFRAGLGNVVDANDYTHWWIHATAITAADSYSKNGLHYHDAKTNGPWRSIVWDYNASFGQAYNSVRVAPNADPRVHSASGPMAANNLWRRMLVDSMQGPLMKARYAAVLKNELKVETVLAILDAFVKEVSASTGRDERLWGATYKSTYGSLSQAKRSDLTTFPTEITYMRNWIQLRWQFLRTMFP